MLATKTYYRTRAVQYARRWAFSRNPAYYDFSKLGGDCTNFISQCIYAGACQMNLTPTFGWYYLSPENRTPSWSGVPFLYNFLTSNKGLGPFARVTGPEEMELGDVIQLGSMQGEFYHSLLVTRVWGSNILVATHTYDALDRPLSSYDYEVARYLHLEGVRVPAQS